MTMVCSLTPSQLGYLKHFILEYTIHNWPVPVTNEPYLESIKIHTKSTNYLLMTLEGIPSIPKNMKKN